MSDKSVDQEDTVRLFEEAHKGNLLYIKELIENRKHKNWATLLDGNQRTALHWAALNGNEELVLYLIEAGSPVDGTDDMGMTPLILASSAGRIEACRTLISKGAEVNAKSIQGHSSIQYAASKSWKEIVTLLLDNGADVNGRDHLGATPLHRAASKGNHSTVRALLDAPGIQLDPKDNEGNTPLHLSCEEGRKEESKLLVSRGANPLIKNKAEQTPLDLASTELGNSLFKLYKSLKGEPI